MEQFPNRWFYVSDVSDELGAVKNTVSKNLSRIENRRSTIVRDRAGNRYRYMYKPKFRISTEILQENT